MKCLRTNLCLEIMMICYGYSSMVCGATARLAVEGEGQTSGQQRYGATQSLLRRSLLDAGVFAAEVRRLHGVESVDGVEWEARRLVPERLWRRHPREPQEPGL